MESRRQKRETRSGSVETIDLECRDDYCYEAMDTCEISKLRWTDDIHHICFWKQIIEEHKLIWEQLYLFAPQLILGKIGSSLVISMKST